MPAQGSQRDKISEALCTAYPKRNHQSLPTVNMHAEAYAHISSLFSLSSPPFFFRCVASLHYFSFFINFFIALLKCNTPMNHHFRWLVSWSVSRSVSHNLLSKGTDTSIGSGPLLFIEIMNKQLCGFSVFFAHFKGCCYYIYSF